MGIDGLHDVHGDHAVAVGQPARGLDLAAQRDQIGLRERFVTRIGAALLDEIGVMVAQVDTRDGAERALARNAAREPVRGNADAHAALHDGQQLTATKLERRE
jgi:hypothetical protein